MVLKPASATVLNTPTVNSTLSNGLVGWWTMDGKDSDAAAFFDKSGSGNVGVKNGGVGSVSGQIGQAAGSFNGSNYLNAGNSSTLNPSIITITAWIKIKTIAANNNTILVRGGADYSFETNNIGGGNETLAFYLNGYNAFRGNTGLTRNKWNFVAVSYDPNLASQNIKFYLNGVPDGTSVTSSPMVSTANYITIGARGGGAANFNLDDVRVYNRALSASEIQQLYTQGGGKINTADLVNAQLRNGLVGWWTMDGKDGSTDKSGHNLNGTNTAITKVAGKIGQAYKFDGTTSAVTLPSFTNTAVISRTAWIKTTSTAQQGVLDNYSNGAGIYFGLTSGVVFVYQNSGNPTGTSGTRTVTDGKWHHIAFTNDGTVSSFYLDGIFDRSTPQTLTAQASVGSIGYGSGAGGFAGSLDDIREYNRVLSATEIQELYKQGGGKINKTDLITAQLRNGLVGYWTMDGKDIDAGSVFDKSGLGNIGTRTGGTKLVSGKIGQAMNFNASDTGVSVAGSSITGTNVSRFAWIKIKNTDPATCGGGRCEIIGGVGSPYSLLEWDGSLSVYGYGFDTPAWVSVATTLVANRWYHVGFTYDGTRLRIFKNGVDIGGNNNAPGAMAAMGSLSVGYLSGVGRYFNGSIDDVRAYSRALSATEVMQLYKMGK